jgi:CHAT domain-containing protein/tetratricopeptide (TPR) repeat protein
MAAGTRRIRRAAWSAILGVATCARPSAAEIVPFPERLARLEQRAKDGQSGRDESRALAVEIQLDLQRLPELSADDRLAANRVLGRVWLDREEWTESAAAFDRALLETRALPEATPDDLGRALADAAESRLAAEGSSAADAFMAEALSLPVADVPLRARLAELEAWRLQWRGDYGGAAASLQEAWRWRSEGPDHPDRARTLLLTGNQDWFEGRLDDAWTHYREAAELTERILGPEHPWLVRMWGRWASLECTVGDVQTCLRLHERAAGLAARVLVPGQPEALGRLNDWAAARELVGDLRGAQELYDRVLSLAEGHGESDLAATVHHNLALLRGQMGALEEATQHEVRAVEIWSRRLGPDHPFLYQAALGWAEVLTREGRSAEARRIVERASQGLERAHGPHHPLVGIAKGRQALLWEREDPARSERLADEALAALGSEGWGGSLERSTLMTLKARLALARREGSPVVVENAIAAGRVRDAYLRRALRYLGERQALEAVRAWPQPSDVAVAALRSGSAGGALVEQAWNLVISSRALVEDEMAARHAWTAPLAGSEDAARLSEQVASGRRQLAQLLYRATGGASSPAEASIRELEREVERKAERLAELTDAGRKLPVASPDLAQLRPGIPAGVAVVAYVRTRKSRDLAPEYVAFVLSEPSAIPSLVGLGPAEPLEEAVAAWRRAAVHSGERPEKGSPTARQALERTGLALRRLVWDPVEKRLGRPGRVLLIPDGALPFVSLAALPSRHDDLFLAEAGWRFHHLSAERDLLARVSAPREERLVLVGGVAFDAAPGSREMTASASLSPASALASLRRGSTGCPSLKDMRFEALPDSRAEGREVEAVFKLAHPGSEVQMLEGALASEERVKALAAHASVLHFATHGFVMDPKCAASASGTTVPLDDPLLYSGLALAGANHRTAVGPDDEDGVLTASEIASLDLREAIWIVLSACDTGLGRAEEGEGVLGLRRAFRQAGARTVIGSLWPVADEATRRFMRHLYEARWRQGLPTSEAIDSASLAALKELRERGELPLPSRWAAFVAVGDWR